MKETLQRLMTFDAEFISEAIKERFQGFLSRRIVAYDNTLLFTPLKTVSVHCGESEVYWYLWKDNDLLSLRAEGTIFDTRVNQSKTGFTQEVRMHVRDIHTFQPSAHERAETLLMLIEAGKVTRKQIEETL